MTEVSFYACSRARLQELCTRDLGPEKAAYRARGLYRAVYKDALKNRTKPCFMALGKACTAWVERTFSLQPTVKVHESAISKLDSSAKLICQLSQDNRFVETILIPERGRLTLCVSTQVGCAQACRFCQTGRMGLARHLSCDEIVGQFLAATHWLQEAGGLFETDCRHITNVVYMGMGEPLDNLEAVIDSTAIFCDAQAFFLSPNKVTVSTVGLLPQLNDILQRTPVCLALSLHTPFDHERTRIMPVNARHPLAEVIACLKSHLDQGSRRSFLIQYTLIHGVNDSDLHAQSLLELLAPYPFKVNLIPLNEHQGTSYRRPDLGRVYQFQQLLKSGGLIATIRFSKGRDIEGACGQLVETRRPAKGAALTPPESL